MSENSPALLIDQILKESKEGKNKKKIGAGIVNLRTQLGLTPAEFAAKLGISVPTVHRWEGGMKLPSSDNLQKLRDLLKPSSNPDWVLAGEDAVCLRSLEFILEREREAKEIWLMKSRPFLSGAPGGPRDVMTELILNGDHVDFNFLFRGLQDDFDDNNPKTISEEELAPYPAKVSFARFKRALFKSNPERANHAHGWTVDEKQAVAVGLSIHCVGTAVIVYKDFHKYKRDVDVFIEFPAAVCSRDNPTELKTGEHLCWIQLPSETAEGLWFKWSHKINKEIKIKREFCKTANEAEMLELPPLPAFSFHSKA